MWKCTRCRKKVGVRSDTCPKCGHWYTLVFDGAAPKEVVAAEPKRPGPQFADHVRTEVLEKVSTGLPEWDFVLSGGMVPGQIVLLAGEPGCGKTSAMLSIAPVVAGALNGHALYLSAEMQEAELAAYAKRIGCRRDNLALWHVTDLEEALSEIERSKPRFIVWDSVQKFRAGHYAPGNDAAIRALAEGASRWAKKLRSPMFLISQVNKDNYAQCPRGVDHDVDTVLYIEPKSLVLDKSRYGVAPRSAVRVIPGVT